MKLQNILYLRFFNVQLESVSDAQAKPVITMLSLQGYHQRYLCHV